MYIHNYLDIINEDRLFGRALEILIDNDIYQFNIDVFKEERDSDWNLMNLIFLNYINNDRNKNKD